MSRFNILKARRIKTSGIKNARIIDQDSVSASLAKAFFDVEKELDMKVKSVLLCIPSVGVQCVKRRVNVPIEEGSKRIRSAHARFGLEKVIETYNSETHQFVNVGAVKYINSGISSRSIPLDEQADTLSLEVELLCVEKEIVYEHAMAVEAAGINILDIYLDDYAIAEESAILENSMERYIVLIDFGKQKTGFTLFHKGNFLASSELGFGYQRFVETIRRKYHLTYRESVKILKESAIFSDMEYNDAIVYVWLEQGEHKQITRKEIYECIKEELASWVNAVNTVNETIADIAGTKMVVSGSGADIVGVEHILSSFSIPAEVYVPNNIGARKGCYTATLGAVYCYRKMQALQSQYGDMQTSLEKNISVHEKDENAFTKKLKSILLNR
ncbi:MAG: hypothetical protein ACK5KR_03595 [Breznakia sp.]